MSQSPKNPFDGFRFEFDPENIEAAIRQLKERVSKSMAQGRHTKVRLSYKGRVIGPDLPLGLFLAGEGVAFLIASPITALLINFGAKAFLDVEFIHESDQLIQEGLAFYLEGELELAEQRYRAALERRPSDPTALYNLGTLLRVSGRTDEALVILRQAAMGPDSHADVIRASEAIARMTHKKTL